MRLEDIAAEVRPRHPWEAVDLGFAMVRTWWRTVFASWLLCVGPVILLLHVALYQHLWLAGLLTWWLKPVYDRVVLHVLSRALFGDIPRIRDTLHALPQLLRSGLLGALTVYRLDPARAFNLPVWQLEGARRRERRRRSGVLQRYTRGTAMGLTFACANMELAAFLGLAGLLLLMMPEHANFGWGDLLRAQHDFRWTEALAKLMYVVALSIIEPFYVAGGFALYLNRRTRLEGWDIELAFRRLAARAQHGAAHPAPGRMIASLLVTVLVLGGLTGIGTRAARAAEALPLQTTLSAKQAHRIVQDVKSAPEFKDWQEIETWHFRGKHDQDKHTQNASPWLEAVGRLLAQLAETVLWIIAVALVVALVVYRRRWLALFRRVDVDTSAAPRATVMFGMDIRPESLPQDIAASAWTLWQEGRAAVALSLLYRGALAALAHREHLALSDSATEGDCLRTVRAGATPATSEYFARLTQAWQAVAYARRTPDTTEARLLCEQWPAHFGQAAERSP